MSLTPFHLAIPVADLDRTRAFYGGLLGLPEGRSADTWIDYNFFGHQLVTHIDPAVMQRPQHTNPVDGHDVPVPHFGIVMEMAPWQSFADQLTAANIDFVIPPGIRFAGQPGEQATMFFLDPFDNALEFKAFADIEGQLFAT